MHISTWRDPLLKLGTTALLAASLGLSGCGVSSQKDQGQDDGGKKAESQSFNKQVPKQAGNSDLYQPVFEAGPASPGFAMDLNNHRAIPNTCLEGEIKEINQQEGYFSLDARYTQHDIENALGIKTSGSAKFLFWGASARANFAHKSRQQGYGLSYVAFMYNKDKTQVFIPKGRNEAWKNASEDEWRNACGDGYVAAQDRGSMLVIKFTLHLDRKSSEYNWSSSARGRGGFLSFAKLKASISANGNGKSKRDTGVLSVSAIQIGGKPSELGKILKSDEDTADGVIQNFALCNVDEVEKCMKGLSSIERYLSDVFPAQIEDEEGKGGSAVIATYPFKYPKTMGASFNPGLDSFVLKARTDLQALYEAEMDDAIRLNQFGDMEDDDTKAMLEKARANVEAIRRTAELCYNGKTYQDCAAKTEELRIAAAETYTDGLLKDEDGPIDADSGTPSGE